MAKGKEEVWKIIEEFPCYSISNYGKVINNKTNKLKTFSVGKEGYPYFSFWKNKKQYCRKLHVLLARAFIPNPENFPQVNHIDGNKKNFSLENLEWVTAKENNIHARRTGLHKSDGDKSVLQFDKSGNFIAEFKSASEASRKTLISRGNICNVANHRVIGNKRILSAGGYKWEWK